MRARSPQKNLLWLAVLLLAIAGCRPATTDTAETPPPAAPSVSPPPLTTPPPPTTTATRPSAAPASPTAIDCNNPQGPTAVNQCAQQAYEAADAKLNEAYQQLKSTLSSEDQSQLTDVEVAWIKFRDSNCNFESSQSTGQETQPGDRASCLESMTRKRTAELQSQANPL